MPLLTKPPRSERLLNILHDIADKMEDELKQHYTRSALDGFDCDDMRRAFGEWYGEDHRLVKWYDRIDAAF